MSFSMLLPTALAIGLLTAQAVVAAGAEQDATMLRVFLRDGTSLVSYGEPARVGDRVVFSMPTSVTPNPPLHLVDLPADRVDWDRTDRYAAAARAEHYVRTQAEIDYAALSNQLGQALNDVASTTDTAARLAIVEHARTVLARWPEDHYNYRLPEVRQMVGMLDEAIADLRVRSGGSRFDISLLAFAEPPPVTERLLPPPTLRESIEQLLTAARTVDRSVDRVSLLNAALGAVDRDGASLPADWVVNTRANVQSAIALEVRVDGSYRTLTEGTLAQANRRAKLADVRGVERLLTRVRARDAELGHQRPEAVDALVAAVEEKLDGARRLRLARDRWALRLPVFVAYGEAIRVPITLFAQLKPALEDIKSLAGSSPSSLTALQRGAARLVTLISAIVPPDELAAAHALMLSAAQLASSAVNVRREAAMANDMTGAWNASSAAAGALMLGARARSDILSGLRPPQLR